MAVLVWDETGKRRFETGIDRGVLYLQSVNGSYGKGVAWSGLSGVTETPAGAEVTKVYADNMAYLSLMSAETLGMTITAYTYPDEFMQCDGTATPTGVKGLNIFQQKRVPFGLCYRTKNGTDTDPEAGYKLHMAYGLLASPSEKAYSTVNESPEALNFSWTVNSTPVAVKDLKPTSLITVSSLDADPAKLKSLEGLLYGAEATDAKLPLPDEIITLFKGA